MYGCWIEIGEVCYLLMNKILNYNLLLCRWPMAWVQFNLVTLQILFWFNFLLAFHTLHTSVCSILLTVHIKAKFSLLAFCVYSSQIYYVNNIGVCGINIIVKSASCFFPYCFTFFFLFSHCLKIDSQSILNIYNRNQKNISAHIRVHIRHTNYTTIRWNEINTQKKNAMIHLNNKDHFD